MAADPIQRSNSNASISLNDAHPNFIPQTTDDLLNDSAVITSLDVTDIVDSARQEAAPAEMKSSEMLAQEPAQAAPRSGRDDLLAGHGPRDLLKRRSVVKEALLGDRGACPNSKAMV